MYRWLTTNPRGGYYQNVTESTAIRYIKHLCLACDIKYWSDPIVLYGLGDGDSNN